MLVLTLGLVNGFAEVGKCHPSYLHEQISGILCPINGGFLAWRSLSMDTCVQTLQFVSAYEGPVTGGMVTIFCQARRPGKGTVIVRVLSTHYGHG